MQEQNQKVTENEVILGKDYKTSRRVIAYISIMVIYFFYNYNFMLGTFMKPTMIADVAAGGFGFTVKQSEEIFAVMSFGTIPGTFLFGWLSTRIGKKNTLVSIALLIALTTFLPLLSPTSMLLWKAARFCAGFVLGGVFGCAMPLVADMFPSKYRGKLAASLTAMFSLAMMFGGWVYAMLGDANWKTLMMTAIIPPIVGAVLTIIGPDLIGKITNLMTEGLGGEIDLSAVSKIGITLAVIYLCSALFTFNGVTRRTLLSIQAAAHEGKPPISGRWFQQPHPLCSRL